MDGNVVGTRSDCVYWAASSPGAVDRLIFTDDGDDTSEEYLDNIVVEAK